MSAPAPAPIDTLPPVPAKPAVDPEVERLQRQISAQDQTIRQMQQTMRTPAQQAAPPAGSQKTKKDAEKEFFSDPLQGVSEIAHNIANAVTQRAMQEMGPSFDTLKETAAELVRKKDPELFDKYEAQIRASLASTPQQFHTNVNTWQLAFDKVKGENIREIIANAKPDTNRAPAIRVSSGGGPAAPSNREPAAAKGEQLSDDEKRVAHRLGLDEDSYKRGKANIAGQNERGKSSWDPYITFSSKERRQQARANANSKSNSNKAA